MVIPTYVFAGTLPGGASFIAPGRFANAQYSLTFSQGRVIMRPGSEIYDHG